MRGLVRFAYKRIIGNEAVFNWDRQVFENSWFEFRLQAQNFTTFKPEDAFRHFIGTLEDPRQLFDRVAPSIYQNLHDLGGTMPQVVDVNGEPCLDFSDFRFEILDTDFEDKTRHKIAITFIASPLFCLGLTANGYLLTDPEHLEKWRDGKEVPTFILPSQKHLDIGFFEPI